MIETLRRAGRARLRGAAAAFTLFALTAPALAEPTQAQIGAIHASCQSDYRANCASVPTGGSAALACLQKNLANLSPAWQKTYPPLSPREELMVIRQSCGPDYRALCAGERPGQGRIAACLRANAASLSEACKSALLGARR